MGQTKSESKTKYNLRNKSNMKRISKPDNDDSDIILSDEYDTVSEYDTEDDGGAEEYDSDDDQEENDDTEDDGGAEDYDTEDDCVAEDSEDEDKPKNHSKKENIVSDDGVINRFEFQKYLSNLFPSKYIKEKSEKTKDDKKDDKKDNKKDDKKKEKTNKETKVHSSKLSKELDEMMDSYKKESKKEKLKKNEEKEDNSKSKSSSKTSVKNITEDKKPKKKNKDKNDNKKNKHKKTEEDSESEDSDYTSEIEEEDDAESTSSDEEDEEETKKSKKNKLNIVFNISGNDEDYDDEYFEDECLLYENEDEECDSDDEHAFMKENYEKVVQPEETHKSDGDLKTKDKRNKKDKLKKLKEKKKLEEDSDDEEIKDCEAEYLELLELKKHLTEKLNKKPNSKILRKAVEECKKEINKLIKKARFDNTKRYHKLIHSDRKKTDEIDYFKKKLSNKEQLIIMKDLKEINKHIHVEKPYRLALFQSSMPLPLKAVAMQKLNLLRSMDPVDPEYYKIKNWVDTFMKIPFGIYKNLSINMTDGIDVCNDFLVNAKHTLDNCVYGLDDAKIQIMQLLGQWISNPSALGTAIAIKGPPGTGKTSIIKDGISKILGREFTFIALGGAGDSSFLEGHSYTYEGSTWGKIVQIIIDSKCMNPVIYFDELDKISDTPRGQEIIGILTHLTDTSQNSQFHDKYFSEIDFDLSKCLFIFSYNDESLVNPILKDRMYRIQTNGYESKEKLIIAKNYLLPKIREQVNFNETDIIIPDDTIQYIIQHDGFTKKEDGVRNLKRCLEIIYTKINLFRLIKPETNLFGKQLDLEVKFPFTVTRKAVDVLIKSDENQKQSILAMYV